MKSALVALIFLVSSMASAAQITGTVSELKVNSDYSANVTLDNGSAAVLSICSGPWVVDGDRPAKCFRNGAIFSILQSSFNMGLKVSITVDRSNDISAAAISKQP